MNKPSVRQLSRLAGPRLNFSPQSAQTLASPTPFAISGPNLSANASRIVFNYLAAEAFS
jgi:hypothetical protein